MSWETSLRVVGKAAAVLEHALQAMGSDSLDQQSEEPNWYHQEKPHLLTQLKKS
jgi:hypothetical protein